MRSIRLRSLLITPRVDSTYLRALPKILSVHSPTWIMYRSQPKFLEAFLTILRAKPPRQLLLNLPFCSLDEILRTLESCHLDSLLDSRIGIHLKSPLRHLIAPLRAHSKHSPIGYSAHSAQEVEEALSLGASYCTLSPIYPTPHKGAPLGIDYLSAISDSIRARIIALGGITPRHLDELAALNLLGFASIRYFLQSS